MCFHVTSVYTWYIHRLCIYQTYTCVCNWYSMYLLLFSGFHGTHCPPALWSHGIEDNMQEAHDDADCDIPDTQAVLERFMFNMSAGPVLAMMNRKSCICTIWWGDISCICCIYTLHILTIIFWYTNYDSLICHVYVVYILYIYWQCFYQGHDSAIGLYIMLLNWTWSSNISECLGRQPDLARKHPPVEYVWPLQPFWRGHSARPGFLQALWGTSLEDSWNHFWTEMQPQLFHISTAAYSRTPLSAAVPMVSQWALPRGGAAMFMRSTPGCGTLDCPSLVLAASQWPRLRRS